MELSSGNKRYTVACSGSGRFRLEWTADSLTVLAGKFEGEVGTPFALNGYLPHYLCPVNHLSQLGL